jgi:hypothetical protein
LSLSSLDEQSAKEKGRARGRPLHNPPKLARHCIDRLPGARKVETPIGARASFRVGIRRKMQWIEEFRYYRREDGLIVKERDDLNRRADLGSLVPGCRPEYAD